MSRTVITENQAAFLEGKKLSTYAQKFEVISRAFGANKMHSDGFQLESEEEYKAFLDAVLSGEWTVEHYVVNISQIMGISNFLAISRDNDGESKLNAKGEITWDVVDFDEAERFTKSELEELVPEIYLNDDCVLLEQDAEDYWGTNTEVTPENDEQDAATAEDSLTDQYPDTTNAIRSVKAVLTTSA